MKLIKILTTVLLFTTLTTGAFAQLRLGAGGGFAFDSEDFAVFARGAYDLSDRLRVNTTVHYYFDDALATGAEYKYNSSLFDVNLDLHYTFARFSTISFYGLGGVNLAIAGLDAAEGSESNTKVGLNLGVGGLFGIADNLDIVTELKYNLGSIDQLFLNAGLLFAVGNK